MMERELKWIRPNISLSKYDKKSEYLITLKNSGNIILDFKKYAECFFNGAEVIMHFLLEVAAPKHDIAKLDLWYFSMLYLYRQSLELILKSAIFKHIPKTEDRLLHVGKIRHDLKQGLDVLLTVIPDYVKSEHINDGIEWLILFFEDISKVDKESDMFRYPFGRAMQTFFKEQTSISLLATHDNMYKAFSIMKDILDKGVLLVGDYDAYEPKLIIKGGSYYQRSVIYSDYYSGKFHPYFTSYDEVGKHFENIIKSEKQSDLFLPM